VVCIISGGRFPFKVVLLDIEGTTTPISFVTENLFPYIRKELENYLDSNWSSEETQQDIKALIALSETDQKNKVSGVVPIPNLEDAPKETVQKAVIQNVIWQMNQDRKSTALKSLQGHMWRKGYKDKLIEG
jgi:enolase-phosphatase E1